MSVTAKGHDGSFHLSFKRAEAARCHRANALAVRILNGPESRSLAFVIFSQVPRLCGRLVLWMASLLPFVRPHNRRTGPPCRGQLVPTPEGTSVGVACPDPCAPCPSPAPIAESQGSQGLVPTGVASGGLPAPVLPPENQRPPSHGPRAQGGRSEPLPLVGESRRPRSLVAELFPGRAGTPLEALTPGAPGARPAQPAFPQAGLTPFPAPAAKRRAHGHLRCHLRVLLTLDS